jgi:hypothetical protein
MTLRKWCDARSVVLERLKTGPAVMEMVARGRLLELGQAIQMWPFQQAYTEVRPVRDWCVGGAGFAICCCKRVHTKKGTKRYRNLIFLKLNSSLRP